jgi:hypothetical protein
LAIAPRAVDYPTVLAPFADPRDRQTDLGDHDADMAGHRRPTSAHVSAAVRGDRAASAHGGTYAADRDSVPNIRSPIANSCSCSRQGRSAGASSPECPAVAGRDPASERSAPARFRRPPHVDRLNFGPLSTTQSWDQPHEGTCLSTHARRAIQRLA